MSHYSLVRMVTLLSMLLVSMVTQLLFNTWLIKELTYTWRIRYTCSYSSSVCTCTVCVNCITPLWKNTSMYDFPLCCFDPCIIQSTLQLPMIIILLLLYLISLYESNSKIMTSIILKCKLVFYCSQYVYCIWL